MKSQVESSCPSPITSGGLAKLVNFDAYRKVVATAAIVTSSSSMSDQSPKFELDSMAECMHNDDVRARGGGDYAHAGGG